MKSQNARILAYLKSGKPITPLVALNKYGCLRLAARMLDLRKQGHDIRTHRVRRGDKTFAAYRLA